MPAEPGLRFLMRALQLALLVCAGSAVARPEDPPEKFAGAAGASLEALRGHPKQARAMLTSGKGDPTDPAALVVLAVGFAGLVRAVSSRPADLGTRTASGLWFALTLLAVVAAFVVLQIAALMLDMRQAREGQVAGAEVERARMPKPETLALGLGAVLVLAVAVPQFLHLATVVPYQTVTACRTGFGPRWYAEVDLSGGGRVSIGHVLGPGDACISLGTSFEKRRWEDAYRVGGEPVEAKASYRQGMQIGVMLGFGLVVVGVGLRTMRRRHH